MLRIRTTIAKPNKLNILSQIAMTIFLLKKKLQICQAQGLRQHSEQIRRWT